MDTKETKEFVTAMMANVLTDHSVLAPHVAREFAEHAMAELLASEYLITNGKIHSVIEVDYRDSTDEHETYEVYTHPEPDEDEETAEGASQEEHRSTAGVDEDGVHYED